MLSEFLQNIAKFSGLGLLGRSAQIEFKGKVSPKYRLNIFLFYAMNGLPASMLLDLHSSFFAPPRQSKSLSWNITKVIRRRKRLVWLLYQGS